MPHTMQHSKNQFSLQQNWQTTFISAEKCRNLKTYLCGNTTAAVCCLMQRQMQLGSLNGPQGSMEIYRFK